MFLETRSPRQSKWRVIDGMSATGWTEQLTPFGFSGKGYIDGWGTALAGGAGSRAWQALRKEARSTSISSIIP